MPSVDLPSVGTRILQLRTERVPKLTQRELAERAGVSVDLIQKLEQGRKMSASIAYLAKIANAMDVDLAVLVSRPTRLESPPVDGGLLALRRAITPVGPDPQPSEGLDLDAELRAAWECYWTGEYDRASLLLPSLISAARAVWSVNVLADAYRCAACVLVHLGHDDLALHAISRAADVADEPMLRAAVQGSRAWILLNQARPDDAAVLAVNEADELEPRQRRAAVEHVVVWGGLLVTAATAYARAGDGEQARDLIRVAHGAAVRLGEPCNVYNTAFSESQVIMQSVDVAVVTGDHAAALDRAERMPAGMPGMPLAARARHKTDMAASHAALGHHGRAEELLLTVEREAPRWIRYQAFPRAVAADLLNRRRPTMAMRSLGRRLGVR